MPFRKEMNMSMVEIETGTYIKRFAFWNPTTWSIPKLYWDAWSQEQRLHAICRQLEKVIAYADYIGVNTDDIAARLKAIEDGQLDDLIVSTVETWFEENEPTFAANLQAVMEALPVDSFGSEETVKDAFDEVNADSWVTKNRIADGAVTREKISDAVFTENLNYYTPEQFGAIGDGTVDDTQAFKDMLEAMPDRSICVLQSPVYKITDTLTIENSFCRFTSFERSENTPNIRFEFDDFTNALCLVCRGTGNNFSNIMLSQSANASGNYLIYIDGVDNSYNIDYTFDNCVFYNTWNVFAITGRNVHITNCLFSTIIATSITILKPVTNEVLRGYVFDNNRFHIAGMLVNTIAIDSYNEIFDLALVNNFVDYSKRLYIGISDNVNISGNSIFQTALYRDFLCLFSTTVNESTSCHVCDNICNTFGATPTGGNPGHVGGLVNIGGTCKGTFEIASNTFKSLNESTGAVISAVGTTTNTQIINIVGNLLYTKGTTTPVQILANPNVKGLIDGNSISTPSTQYFISAGNLTVGTNFAENMTF